MSNLKTNKYFKSTYDESYGASKAAISKGADFTLNNTLSFTTAGLAGGVPGMVGGAIIGLMLDGIGWAFRDTAKKDENAEAVRGMMRTANANFIDYSKQRNQFLDRTNAFIANTRSTFDSTFGVGSYDFYDKMFSDIKSTSSIADILANTAKWSESGIDENTGEQLMMLDGMSQEQITNLLTKATSIQDFNKAYQGYLSEYFSKGNTAYAYQMNALSMKDAYLNQQYKQSMNSVNGQIANQLDSMMEQRRQQNYANASARGQVEAQAGSSGIRQTGSGRNMVAIQNYETLLQTVQFASALDYLMKSYRNQLETTQAGYLYESYANRNAMQQTKLQQINSFIDSGNKAHASYLEYYYNIEALEDNAAKQLAAYEGYAKAVAEYEESKGSNDTGGTDTGGTGGSGGSTGTDTGGTDTGSDNSGSGDTEKDTNSYDLSYGSDGKPIDLSSSPLIQDSSDKFQSGTSDGGTPAISGSYAQPPTGDMLTNGSMQPYAESLAVGHTARETGLSYGTAFVIHLFANPVEETTQPNYVTGNSVY